MNKTKKKNTPVRVCGQCYHEYACFAAFGGCGCLTNTDATNCVNYETIQDIVDKYAELLGYVKSK